MTKIHLKQLIKEIIYEIVISEGNAIKDEFADLPISQQRKWQLRMRKQSRCVICGKPAVYSSFWCEKHFEDHSRREKERIRKVRHPEKNLDYQIEESK